MKPSGAERIIRELLGSAGIAINGSNPWDIEVHDQRFYGKLLGEGALGLGESYVDGWWDCDRVDQLIDKILRGNLKKKMSPGPRTMFHILRSKLLNLQSRSRAFQVGRRHYDIGKELYEAMLESRMNYTCAYWK